jgi:hypothetical protein
MKALFLAISIACAIIGAAQAAAPANPPAELAVLRQALAKAIAAHDMKATTALIAFPLAVDMYQAPPQMTLKQVTADKRKLTVLFGDGDKDLLKCVATAPVTVQGDKTQFGFGAWVADCNGNEFYFAQRGGKWLFTAYQNINE